MDSGGFCMVCKESFTDIQRHCKEGCLFRPYCHGCFKKLKTHLGNSECGREPKIGIDVRYNRKRYGQVLTGSSGNNAACI